MGIFGNSQYNIVKIFLPVPGPVAELTGLISAAHKTTYHGDQCINLIIDAGLFQYILITEQLISQ